MISFNNTKKIGLRTNSLRNYSFIALLLLAACNDATQLSKLAEKSIIYCSEGTPENFNPQLVLNSTSSDATTNQVYNKLLTFNEKNNTLEPSLAKSWHITRDGKKITFYLRKNVTFHATDYFYPSRSLTADDVVFSFKRISDPYHPYHHVSSGFYPYFSAVNFDSLIESIEKINEHTVRFTLTEGDASFISHFASPFAVVLSEEYAQILLETDNFTQIDLLPIGTGPYKLQEYRAGTFIRYYRHEEYWQGAAKAQQLIYDITPSNTGRLTKLLTNECDVIANPIAHQKIQENSALILESTTAFDLAYLSFNTQKPPLNNKDVRAAIAHAIDKNYINKAVYFSQAAIAKSIEPPVSWAYSDKNTMPSYDINKAKALMKKAGYTDGFTLELLLSASAEQYNPDALAMAEVIKNNLAHIGITVNLVEQVQRNYMQSLEDGWPDMAIQGWSFLQADPHHIYSPILSCSPMANGNNYDFWCSDQVETLLQQAIKTDSMVKRKHYYQMIMAIVATDIPILPIAHSKRFQARNQQLKGNILTPLGVDFTKAGK